MLLLASLKPTKRLNEMIIMKNFEEMKMKEIIKIDVENVAKKVLWPNKEALSYDEDACAWFIRGEEVVDLLWHDCYTILHPKEIIGYIDEYIEDIMEVKKMSVSFLNTRAVIEDYGKGKIGEIIFDNYGYTKNKEFFIIHPEKLAYEIGRDLCDNNNNLNIDDVTLASREAAEEIRDEIIKFLVEYIQNNFEGEYDE